VIDHWWQTETGWAIAANLRGIEPMPVKAGSATLPVPGFNVQILDEQGKQLPTNTQGNIAVKLPMPPSCLTTIWGDMPRFKRSYLETYPGYYLSGDGGYIDDDGYLFVMGRVDDVINVAGHRLSTGEMEEVVGKHKAVAECAVVGRNDELKGQMPLGFVVLKSGADIAEEQLIQELVALVRTDIGPVACFKEAHVVPRLPKTRSGKILRRTIRQIVNGEEYTVPSTIDDPGSLDEIKQIMTQA
jgi:propionyl-CoA synthetase